MQITKGMTVLLLSSVLAVPMAASANPGRNEAHGGYGDKCSDHGKKSRCYDENSRGKGNSHAKKPRRDSGDYRSAGGPPPWAPAHGWRRKNERDDHRHEEYVKVVEHEGTRAVVRDGKATVDVGIDKGTCNRKVIGTVAGGIIGGVIGNQVGKDGNREVATVLGAVIGGVVGNRIGDRMDKSDQQCTGQALEQATDKQTVRWADKDNNGEYRVTPQRTYQADGGRYCRDYITEYQKPNGEVVREKSTACRTQDGSWQRKTM